MFKLYYLIDQEGDVHGDKRFVASFESVAAAVARAEGDGIAHYSVEQDNAEQGTVAIVLIV